MAIPYRIVSLLPGRFKIKSEFFKYLPVSESAVDRFITEQQPGVKKVSLNKLTGSIIIEYDGHLFNPGIVLNLLDEATPEMISMVLSQLEEENVSTETAEPEDEGWDAKKWLTLNSLGFLPFLFRSTIPAFLFSSMTMLLATPVFKKALHSIKNKKLDVHLLDSSAIALSTLLNNPFSSLLMVWLLSLGDVIEGKTRGSAAKEIEKLLNFTNESAWLIMEDERIIKVSVPEVTTNSKIVVYTGEKIVVDGKVISGEAMVNQTSLTGESNPVHKKEGDKVYAGTFIVDGKINVVTERVGDDTALAQIVKIIQEGSGKPIEIQKHAEAQANKFVVPTFAAGGAVFALTQNLARTVSTLTFDYHTGVHVSTPTSIMSHMALAAKHGILFKSGRHLEIIHHVDTIVFDKTGTLTIGHPEITQLISYGVSEEEVLKYAACLEQRVTHPVARSIVQKAEDLDLTLPSRKNSKYHMGYGMEAEIDGHHYLIGSSKFMEKENIKVGKKIKADVDSLHAKGESALYLVKEKTIIALIAFTDPLRPESKSVVKTLHALGREVILCTGDNEDAARAVAAKLNIRKYHARCFPDEKARVIRELKAKGKTIAFMGDGVNDSPALSVSDIGISINSGAEIAIEVADVVIGNDLNNLIEAIKISDSAMENMQQNYRINKVANTFGVLGAIAGVFSPVMATMINNGTTVFMGMNAVKPLWQYKQTNNYGQITQH